MNESNSDIEKSRYNDDSDEDENKEEGNQEERKSKTQ